MPPTATEPVSSLSSAAGAPVQKGNETPAPAVVPAVEKPAAVAPAVVIPAVASTGEKRFANPEAPITEEKPAASAEVKPGEKPADPAAVAKPEEWTLAAPKDTTVPEVALKAVEAFAKEHKLTKDVAEKILARDLAAETARTAAAQTEAVNIGNVWHDQVMAHPDLGGANAKASEALVNKAMLAFLPTDMRKDVYGSPFINNPIFRLFAHNAAKLIPVEDGVPPVGVTKPAAVSTKSPAERIYGRT